MKKIILYSIIICISMSCEPTLVAEFQDKAVVEAYLHAGSAPSVKISKLIPFRSDVSYAEVDIYNLSLTIFDESDGNSAVLNPQGGGLYVDSGFTIIEGHIYSLYLPYNESIVISTTLIPAKPMGMALSSTSISVMGRPGGMMSLAKAAHEPVEVTWTNDDNSYYMVVVENIESNPTSIYDWDDDEDRPKPMFRMEPTQSASTQLSQQSFSYYGKHNVILIKMRPEYALLYQTQTNTSQSISEIHANVENGYGIFTGLNSDTLTVYVSQSSGF